MPENECCEDLETLLNAWIDLVNKTNEPNTTEGDMEDAYRAYDEIAEGVAVKNGHPPGKPRRRP